MMSKYIMGEKEKQKGLCNLKRGRTGDRNVVKKRLMGVACTVTQDYGEVSASAVSKGHV